VIALDDDGIVIFRDKNRVVIWPAKVDGVDVWPPEVDGVSMWRI